MERDVPIYGYYRYVDDRGQDFVVMFTGLTEGTVVAATNSRDWKVGDIYNKFIRHDDTNAWEQLHNYTPQIDTVSTRGDGGATSYYELPEGATELGHIIKHKKMEHGIGEAFCALYRLNDNGEYLRNLKKVQYYIEQEIAYASKTA